ncbi:MAG: hypothetical protein AAFY78_20520 [Cyanobacteria bacterium J06648_16]
MLNSTKFTASVPQLSLGSSEIGRVHATDTQPPHTVCCPHCGQLAQRQYIDVSELSPGLALRCRQDQVALRTSCPACDYLMSFCPRSGAVLEAYTF